MTEFLLNPGQVAAVSAPHDKPVRVVAGAGTGKTEVVSRRFIHLLRQQADWRPENILVLTFSEKAATEMRARIFQTVIQANLGYTRLDLAAAGISTFHSFSARLLADHSLLAHVDPSLPLLTEIDVQHIIDEAQFRFLERDFETAYGEFNPLDNDQYDWTDGGPFDLTQALIGQLRNQAVDPGAFRQWLASTAHSPQQRTIGPLVDWLYTAYITRLIDRGQIDFDRLIMDAATIVQNDLALRQSMREQYRAILVDEYQDTNFAQEKLLRALAADGLHNVTVVGDPRQAIYVWREARVENIGGFPGPSGVRVDIPLTENRRSLRPILEVANRAIEGYEFDLPAEFDIADILQPSAENDRAEGIVINLYAAPTREEEAQAVASWIEQVRDEGYGYHDIAIILRARTYLQPYLDALTAAGIPFELSAADAYYTRPEILDAIHLLRICLDPTDELSLARMLFSPTVGLTQGQLAELKKTSQQPLWRIVVGTGVTASNQDVALRLARFVAFWQEAQAQRWTKSPAMFAAWAIRQSGLQASVGVAGQRALSKLMAIAHDYEASHPGEALPGLINFLRLMLEGDPREKAPELNTEADSVRILTAHASKGLEFPVVIAADCRQKVRPKRDFAPFHDPTAGLIFPDSKTKTHSPEFEARVRRARNEARCLWYVTLTRAKRRLIITASNDKTLHNGAYETIDTFFEELWNKEAQSLTPGVVLGSAPNVIVNQVNPIGSDQSTAHIFEAARSLKARLSARLLGSSL